MIREFRLYPSERPWWSFADYGAVLDVMERLRPAHVLEFGPGSSTLALIEGGARRVDTCEDDPIWAGIYEQRLVGVYPQIVHLHRYEWRAALSIKATDARRYDLALVDGPRGVHRRMAVIRYAMARSSAVLVPLEEISDGVFLRNFLLKVLEPGERARPWCLEVKETGPLSGAFGLLTRAAV